MDDMARYPGLVRRRARWYLRSRIPADLTDFLKRAELWRSLGTVEFREAVRRYTLKRAELQSWFDQQRRRRDAGQRLNGEAPRLVVDWFRHVEHQAAHADFSLTGELLRSALGEVEEQLVELLDGGADEDVTAAVNASLISAGWPARPHVIGSISTRRTKVADGEVPAALPELVRRASIELARRRRDRLNGEPARVRDPLFANGAIVQPGAPGRGQGALLSQVAERWIEECGPGWARATEIEFRAAARMLQEALGDVPIDTIDRAALREFKGLLLRAPFRSHPRYGRVPLPRAVEASANDPDARRLAPPSVNKYLGAVHMLMQWACDNGYRQDNPATKLKVPLGRRPDKERRPFTAAEQKTLFGPAYASLRGHRRWLPLLAVYTGARLEELAQLQVTDVRRVRGVRVIAIAPGNGKKLKSRAAERVIPVHPALVRAGFLRYAAQRAKAARRANREGRRLFPELRPGARGDLSQGFSKWYGRYRQALGITDPHVGMHAFRHGFADALRAAGVEPELRNAVMGHSQGHVGARYGDGWTVHALAQRVAELTFPGMPQVVPLDDKERSASAPGRVVPDMAPEEITSFIDGHDWRFAKTMPHIPHWHVVKERCRDPQEFERFVMHIRRHGYRAKFGSRYYTYLDWPVDGVVHQFWTMGEPLDRTIIINRAVKRVPAPPVR
jgi:integrase